MAIAKRPLVDEDNSERRTCALLELATVGLIGAGTFALFTPFSISLLLGAATSVVTFMGMYNAYRFEIPENTSALLVGPNSQLQIGQGWYWKYRGEVINADNVTSSGVRPAIEMKETIEGSDKGNRIEFVGYFGFTVANAITFNVQGSEDQATGIIARRVKSDFKDYCSDEMRHRGQLKETDSVILEESRIRADYITFIKRHEQTYLDDYGIAVSWGTTLMDNIDYDLNTKRIRQERAEAVTKAKAERERQNIITDGVDDKRLALAADNESKGVIVEAFELDVNFGGDPAIASMVAEVAKNPTVIGAAANAARARKGDKK
jgi:hypothetical protein